MSLRDTLSNSENIKFKKDDIHKDLETEDPSDLIDEFADENINNEKVMTVYHSSQQIIKEPLVEYINNDCDYGNGFYTTQSFEDAYRWGQYLYGDSENKNIKINKYIVHIGSCNVIDLTDTKDSLFELCIVLRNTEKLLVKTIKQSHLKVDWDVFNYNIKLAKIYSKDINNYDIIIGNRVDSAYKDTLISIVTNKLCFDRIDKIFTDSVYGKQVCIKPNAYGLVKFNKALDREQRKDLYEKYRKQEDAIRNSFNYINSDNNLTMLLEKGVKKND